MGQGLAQTICASRYTYLLGNWFLATTAELFQWKIQLKQLKNEDAECNAILLSGKIFKAQGMYSEALECFNQFKPFAKTVLTRESLSQQANELISECIECKEQLKIDVAI